MTLYYGSRPLQSDILWLFLMSKCVFLVQVQLSDIASPTLASLVQRVQELIEKLHILKVDRQEFACIKFLILFNPGKWPLQPHSITLHTNVSRATGTISGTASGPKEPGSSYSFSAIVHGF